MPHAEPEGRDTIPPPKMLKVQSQKPGSRTPTRKPPKPKPHPHGSSSPISTTSTQLQESTISNSSTSPRLELQRALSSTSPVKDRNSSGNAPPTVPTTEAIRRRVPSEGITYGALLNKFPTLKTAFKDPRTKLQVAKNVREAGYTFRGSLYPNRVARALERSHEIETAQAPPPLSTETIDRQVREESAVSVPQPVEAINAANQELETLSVRLYRVEKKLKKAQRRIKRLKVTTEYQNRTVQLLLGNMYQEVS